MSFNNITSNTIFSSAVHALTEINKMINILVAVILLRLHKENHVSQYNFILNYSIFIIYHIYNNIIMVIFLYRYYRQVQFFSISISTFFSILFSIILRLLEFLYVHHIPNNDIRKKSLIQLGRFGVSTNYIQTSWAFLGKKNRN